MTGYRSRTVILVLLSFVLGCSEFIVVGVLSDIASDLHRSISAVGELVTIFALVYALSTPVVTALLGRLNHLFALLILMAVFILGNLFSAFSSGYLLLCISRILTAVVSGPIISLSLTFASRIAPPEQKPLVISWVFSGFSIASVLGVPIGVWISAKAGWRVTFLSIALLSVVILLMLALALPRGGELHTGTIVQQLRLFHDRRIQLGMLLPMFGAAGVYVVYTYLRPIFSTVLGYSVSTISVLLFLFGFFSILSNQLSGLIAKRSGLRMMPVVYIVQVLLLFLLPVFFRSKPGGTAAIMVLGVTMYLLNSPIQLHFLTIAENEYRESIVLASSLNSIFFNFGISLGSLVGSLIVGSYGLRTIGVGGGALLLIALGLTLGLNRLMAGHTRLRNIEP